MRRRTELRRAGCRGGWQRGVRHENGEYLPLTPEVVTAHLSGQVHLGPYSLMDGDRCLVARR